jgi:hypothetical protein
MFSRRLLRALLPFWVATVIVGSFLPAEAKRAIGTQSGVHLNSNPGWPHRAWHIGTFGFTALLVSLACREPRQRFWMLTGVFGLGLGIEVTQPVVFGSQFEWWDMRDNGYGIAATAVAGQLRYVRTRLLSNS